MPKELAIIANPVAGGGRPYERMRRHLQHAVYDGWTIRLIPTNGPEHAGQIAYDLVADHPDIVAVCGGDGTIHEVASRVPDPPFPVAVLPAGTSNALARELGIPLDPIKALAHAMRAPVVRVDTGVARGRIEHTFLLMAGVGFDAYVVSKVRPHVKRRLGRVAFYIEALRALAGYGFPEFQVIAGDEEFTATSCVVANSKGYGGGLLLTPQANMTDGILELLVVRSKRRLDYTRFLLSAWLRKPHSYAWLESRRVRSVEIRGHRGPWVQVDGELMGTLPLTVSVLPSAFPLISAADAS